MAGWVRAADDVSDLMEVLHPSKVDRFCDEKDGKEIWHRDVELPAAMLVSTMEELSAWGPVRAPPCAFVCCVLYVPHAACCVLRAACCVIIYYCHRWHRRHHHRVLVMW
jgi:hypothetical protein